MKICSRNSWRSVIRPSPWRGRASKETSSAAHDLDMSIPAAIPMAEVERDLGLRKALISCCFERRCTTHFPRRIGQALFSLMDRGHEIGLHLTLRSTRMTSDSMEEAVDMECRVLETLIQRGCGRCFHRPAKSLQGGQGPIAGRVQTYQPNYLTISDTVPILRGAWFRCPLIQYRSSRTPGDATLTHPIW